MALGVSALQYIPLITGNPHQFDGLYKVMGVLQGLAALARGTLALIHRFGWFAQAAADAAVGLGSKILGGLPDWIVAVITWAAGPVINNLLTGGAHALTAAGDFFYSQWQNQENEGINTWCTQNPGVCSPKSSYGL